jgi:hypothetical protein
MTNRHCSLLFAVAAAFLLGISGCGKSPAVDPAVVAEHRARLTLAEEPADAQPVQAVRFALYGVNPEEHASADSKPAEAEYDHAAEEDGEKVSTEAENAGHDHADHDHSDHDHADHDHADHDHEHAAEPDPTAGKKPVVSEMDVVLAGVVGGLPNPSEQSHPDFPFSKGKAVIFVADPDAVAEMAEHEHHHAPGEECSFCAAHSGDSARYLAVIHFTDATGKPLAVDARDLFGLKEQQHVVVRGKAKVDPSGLLTVAANGIYVRK